MDRRVLILSAVMATLMLASAVMVFADTDESDAATLSYNVGDTMSNQGVGIGDSWTGSIPGITFDVRQSGGQFIVVGNGTFTTAGTYTIKTYMGSTLHDTTTVTVSGSTPPTPTTYTVSFSADPSAGGSVSTSSITVASGTTYSLSGTSLLFSDGQSVSASPSTGYYQTGWSSTSGTITSNKSIRAYFALNQYTVTFGTSPSAGGSVDLRSSTAYYGDTYSSSGNTLTIYNRGQAGLTATATPASGYQFDHWSSSSGTITSDKTITAYFTSSPSSYTCYLYYDANGGYLAPSTQSYTGTSTSSHTFTISSSTPTWTGHTFLGWSTSSSASTASYQPGGTISVGYNSSKTLYAVWQADTPTCSYTVESTPYATITVNGTVISTDYTGTVQSGGTITVSAVMDPNYTFTDWLVYEPDTGTVDYISTLSFTDHIYEDTVYTLEATYTPPTSDPVITFNRNSSSWGSVSQNTLTVVSGTTFTTSGDTMTFRTGSTVVATVTATPATGYYFDHWSVSSGTITTDTSIMAYFGEPLRFSYDVGESVSAILYSDDSSLTITGVAPPGTTVTARETYVPPTSLTPALLWTDVVMEGTPTTTGTYNIIVSDGTHLEITINPSGTHTFRTITFSTSPAQGGTVSTQSMTVRDGSTWTVSGNEVQIQQPGEQSYRVCTATANPGYDFTAWNRSGTGTVNADMTFTATFVPQTIQHTVSFYAYPSGAGTFSPSSVTVAHNTPYTVSADGQTLTIGSTTIAVTPASGYAFLEWGVFGTGYITDDESWPANFTSATHTVTIIADPSAGGTISQSTITVDHGSAYAAYRDSEYSAHLTIGNQTVTALAEPNYTFQAWNHSGSGTVISDMTFVAYFSLEQYSFSVRADPSVGGTIIPHAAQMVPVGTSYTTSGNTLTLHTSPAITITAEPTSGFRFDHWGSDSGEVDRNRTVVAYFIGTDEHTVEIAVSPEDGGRVSHEYIDVTHYTTFQANGNVMVFTDASGTQEVTATPAEGFTFLRWDPSVGIVNRSMSVTAVFDRDYSVTVEYNRNATITVDGVQITRNTTFIVNQENRHSVECVPNNGYRFACYTYVDAEGHEVQTNENPSPLPLSNTRFAAMVVLDRDVTVTFTTDGHGTVNPDTLTVPAGSKFTRQGDSLVLISDPTVVATASPDIGYVLRGWSENADQFILNNTTIKAFFEYDMGNAVWWANDYANNRATIVLDYPQTLGNYSHYMKIPLLEYSRLAEDGDPQYFRDTGYVLTIETGFNKKIYVTLTKDGVEKYAATYDPGVWQRYALILDTREGTLSYQGISSAARNPVDEFNFMDYTPIFTNVIADWSSVEDDLAFARIYHRDVGSGSNHPNFQIGNTATFLNTYGVVMIDPVLNIYEQFPAYENLRLNLYSFALYGDSITLNGRTFDMDGAQITIRYDKVGDRNIISPTGAETFTAFLTNIYITWTNIDSPVASERQCYLTFADRNQTFELGSYALGDLTISGEGMWYFTTALWEPYDTVKKTYVMDWSSPFNLSGNGFILIFIALLVVVLVIMNVFWQPTVLDYVVVFGAGLVSLLALGVF